MRSWIRISRDAAVEALFFLKLGGPLVPVPDPGLKGGPLVPDAYSRVENQD